MCKPLLAFAALGVGCGRRLNVTVFHKSGFPGWLDPRSRSQKNRLSKAFSGTYQYVDRRFIMTCAPISAITAYQIRPEAADDIPAIEALNAEAFGPGRFTLTAHRIRESSKHGALVALTAWHGAELAGSVHLTPITIGDKRGALLLGPLAVAQKFRKNGCGAQLMRAGLSEGARFGYGVVVLIGDLPYYQREGFEMIPTGQILLPGPVDPNRLLAKELYAGALARFTGMVAADNEPPFELCAATPQCAAR
jgi:predicted N-acetyltransferase YhbS